METQDLGDPENSPFTVAIVGGGIGGLCLAIALLKRGVCFQVYEQAPEFKETGLGVGFGPNSLRAMGLIDPVILKSFKELATEDPTEGDDEIERTWINFRLGHGVPTLVAPVKTRDTTRTGICGSRRAPFIDKLVEQIPKDVCHFNKRLIDVEKLFTGELKLVFEDGSVHFADAVVGADGIRSSVRQLAFGGESHLDYVSFTQTVCYRALVPMQSAIDAMGKELATTSGMYIGPGGHILTYPIDRGAMMNVVACTRQARWHSDAWAVKNVPFESAQKAFAHWGPNVQNLLKAGNHPPTHRTSLTPVSQAMKDQPIDLWSLWDSAEKPLASYCKDRLVLLGDAAHASLPHQGAGAGQAIEDALVLAEVLASPHVKGSADLPAAFQAYDAIRRPRSQKVVQTSREAGDAYRLEGPDGADLERVGVDLRTRMNWIWYEDQDLQSIRAKEMCAVLLSPSRKIKDDQVKPAKVERQQSWWGWAR